MAERRIVLLYRRAKSGAVAVRLLDVLDRHYRKVSVIDFGLDDDVSPETVSGLAGSDILLVLVDPEWESWEDDLGHSSEDAARREFMLNRVSTVSVAHGRGRSDVRLTVSDAASEAEVQGLLDELDLHLVERRTPLREGATAGVHGDTAGAVRDETIISTPRPERPAASPIVGGTGSVPVEKDGDGGPDPRAGSTGGAAPPPTIERGARPIERPQDSKRTLKRYRLPGLAALVLIAAGVVALIVTSTGGTPRPAPKPAATAARFVTSARPVPTNRVTATGAATVVLHGNQVTVTLDTNGLLDGSPHLMHIHAGGIGECPPASAARLHNHHLAIDTKDGLHWYGPPEASLTVTGDTSATTLQHSILAFGRYPSVGNIRYQRTFDVAPGIAAAIRADDAVIVVHGIDYDHSGSYNDVLGQSQLNPGIPSEATAPALCGTLMGSASASTDGQRAPRGAVFVATLQRPVARTTSTGRALGYALLCHLLGLPTPAAATSSPSTTIRGT